MALAKDSIDCTSFNNVSKSPTFLDNYKLFLKGLHNLRREKID